MGSYILASEATGSVASGGLSTFHLEFDVEARTAGKWVYVIHSPGIYSNDPRGVWGVQIP
jgi:hypothetical protein